MRRFEDTYRHRGLRKKLIDSIREKGITDEQVLKAMLQIPRHYFMDKALADVAYQDRAFPISEGQTISQPYTVAYQTQLLKIRPTDKVLEIGTGSGYQAMVLAEMGARLYTIERQKKLYDKLQGFFLRSRYPAIKYFYGDGFKGLPAYAPFDKIIITAAAPFIPTELTTQLKPGGIIVLPVDEGGFQRMIRGVKNEDGTVNIEKLASFSFVPMLKGREQ